MNIDLSAVVMRFAAAYTVRGQGVGSYVNGEWTAAAEASREVQALIYPMTGKELQRLPENERTQNKITIFSHEELLTGDQNGATPGEVVEFRGADWEVDKVEQWDPQGKYWQCTATRRGRG